MITIEDPFYGWDVSTPDSEFEISSGFAAPPAQAPSKGATAPTACGLLRVATDGERVGRLTAPDPAPC